MIQNSLVSIGVVIAVLGGVIGYVLFIQSRNRKKSNQINLMQYEDDVNELKEELRKLNHPDLVERFNKRVEERKSKND